MIEAHDLEGEAFISIEPGTLFRYRTDELFGQLGVRRKLRLEAQSTVMVCSLVAQGLGGGPIYTILLQRALGLTRGDTTTAAVPRRRAAEE